MLPPGSPPSSLFTGSIGAPLVRRAARRDDRVGQLLQRLVGGDRAVVLGAVVVLDLLQGDDVGRGEVVHDRRRRARRTSCGVGRVEVLDVVRRDRQLAALLLAGRLALQAAVFERAERCARSACSRRTGCSPAGPRSCRSARRRRSPSGRAAGDRRQRLDLEPAGVLRGVRAVDRAAAAVVGSRAASPSPTARRTGRWRRPRGRRRRGRSCPRGTRSSPGRTSRGSQRAGR